VRFATEVIQGARTIRLAMGLYLRGLGPDNKSIVGRWPSQMAELKQLQDLSGIEGWAPEYWSPPTGWKDSKSYYTGTLTSFNATFLDEFGDGVRRDVEYLRENGLKVTWWGLQNEPGSGPNTTTCPPQPQAGGEISVVAHADERANSYSECRYTQCNYYYAFKAVAPKIKQLDPTIRIHANSWNGQVGAFPIAHDPKTLALVDAWTWHTVGASSARDFGNSTPWAYGKLDFTNEHEYQPGSPWAGTEVGTVACVNSYLNTLTFKNSPTGVIMLHAAKPTTNLESLGYGWAWWRSTGTNASKDFPDLEEQHWEYNFWNWNTVAPFTKTLPWNSIRRNVMEDTQRLHQRVVAFETPEIGVERGPVQAHAAAGKLIIVVTNEGDRAHNGSYTTTVGTTDGKTRTWLGFSFKGDSVGKFFNVSLGAPSTAASFKTTLAPNTIQWWYEQ
jgi:hypothetical protein